ncbi:MAG: inositol monophosphatase [Verrucomicrobiota bacterium JB022]|nr:inositol monophosphatase [Verrucomicrobiota bacterium JB022]
MSSVALEIPWEVLRRKVCVLHRHLQSQILAARQAGGAQRQSEIDRVSRADVIYRVDARSEEVILRWFADHWPQDYPVELVMEGLEGPEPVTFPPRTPLHRTVVKCIIDPVDGTRPFMFDKRSAWILTGLAPQRLHYNTLADIQVAVMTELPCSKQYIGDQLSAARGEGVMSCRMDVITGRNYEWKPAPYPRAQIEHGFYSVVKFFPTGKARLAELEERLIEGLGLNTTLHGAEVFDDQYLSTGGQLYELAAGRDRFHLDLRPLVNTHLRLPQKLACHPYDLCTSLILQELGGVVEQPNGDPLDAPLDTTTPIAWAAYANAELANRVRPVLQEAIAATFDDRGAFPSLGRGRR